METLARSIATACYRKMTTLPTKNKYFLCLFQEQKSGSDESDSSLPLAQILLKVVVVLAVLADQAGTSSSIVRRVCVNAVATASSPMANPSLCTKVMSSSPMKPSTARK